MRKITIALTIASIGAAGCSTASKDISSISVSPLVYHSYDCDQLVAENARLTSRISQLGGRLDEAASNDKAITGVGIILFWPALFALGGTKQEEAEFAKVKGEFDAMQQSMIIKKCGMTPAVIPAMKEASDQQKPST